MDALDCCLTLGWQFFSLDAAAYGSAISLLAYIDPGSGSLIFQIIVAGLLSTSLMVRGLRDRIWVAACLPLKLFQGKAAATPDSRGTRAEATTMPSKLRPQASDSTAKKAA
jgi:hypothetical protein